MIYRAGRYVVLGLLILVTISCKTVTDVSGDTQKQLSAGVQAASAVRTVKRLQNVSAQFRSAGLWQELGDLHTTDVTANFPGLVLHGREALTSWYQEQAGRNEPGLDHGQLNLFLNYQPIVTLGANGMTARATWHELGMIGRYGDNAWWQGGVYENEYRLEDGTWKISAVNFFPQYEGDYVQFGHTAPPTWDIPYHFNADDVGVAVPQSALLSLQEQSAPLGPVEIDRRIRAMQDETDIINLMHSFGYYYDRKLWDDVAELFTDNAILELEQRGLYLTRDRIRQALEVFHGAYPLGQGELFEHMMLGSVVTPGTNGRKHIRTMQLSQLGRNGEYARWEAGVYESVVVRQNGQWKFESLKYFPMVRTDFDIGWGRDAKTMAGQTLQYPPDSASSRFHATYPDQSFLPFHYAHPVTSQPLPILYGFDPLRRVAPANSPPELIREPRSARELRSSLHAVMAVDAVENLNSAYGYYIDESDWDGMADTYSVDRGVKEITGVGAYVGRERIRHILKQRGPTTGRSPAFFTIHQLVQPVITVSADGETAQARMRLFQAGGSADGTSGSWIGGIYENTAVFEDGEWKFGVQDLHHLFSASYVDGWARYGEEARLAMSGNLLSLNRYFEDRTGIRQGLGGARGPSSFMQEFPPNGPIRSIQYAFPEITEPAFHYRNPVSGRAPLELIPLDHPYLDYPRQGFELAAGSEETDACEAEVC